MTLVFTLCSKNYLGQATTLYDSFRKHNPEIAFIIGVVDKLSVDQRKMLDGYKVLEVDELGSDKIKGMYDRYNIIELNTAVKPYYIEYFFTAYQASKVIYFDPDVLVLHPVDHIIEQLETFSYLLTPHFCSPIYDNFLLTEQVTLATGTFNLGFCAVKNDINGNRLIDWWCKKLLDECIMDLSRSYFVDQKWMNLSVCYFESFLVDRHLGMNMAHWNLHERVLTSDGNGGYLVNNMYPLIFFHFSSYKPDRPMVIADWQNRFSFETRPDLVSLFDDYRRRLESHHYAMFKSWRPEYGLPVPVSKQNKFSAIIKNRVKQLVGKYKTAL